MIVKRASRQSRILVFLGVLTGLLICSGCDSLRFAPSEKQKQNAWLHNRTALMAARTARADGASQQLQSLTELSELQSRAFTSYFGLPREFPQADAPQQILSEPNRRLAQTAIAESVKRPDPWDVADSVLELGVGICAVLGGVCGTRAIGYLKQARDKSRALREIVTGNELFKKSNAEAATAFKEAHRNQSAQTRQLVTAIKS